MIDDRESPALSIIVPVHGADYLEELLRSLRKQAIEAEIIVVVDGGSQDVLAALQARRDERSLLVVPLTTQGGAGRARNVGLEHASGTYVAFADADDVVEPAAYERLLRVARATGDDVVTGSAIQFLPDGSERPYWTTDGSLHDVERRNLTLLDEPRLAGDHTPWNKIFRRSFLDESDLRFPEGSTSEDVGFWASVVVRARISVIPDVVYRHRRHDASVTARLVDSQAVIDWGKQLRLASTFYGSSTPAVERYFFDRLLRREVWTRVRRLPELDADARAALVDVVAYCLDASPPASTEKLGALREWSYHLVAGKAVDSAAELIIMTRKIPTRTVWDAWNTSDSTRRILLGSASVRTVAFWREAVLFPFLKQIETGSRQGDPSPVVDFLAADEKGTENEHEEQVLAVLRTGDLTRIADMRRLRHVRPTVFVTTVLGLSVIRRAKLTGDGASSTRAMPVTVVPATGESKPARVVRARSLDALRVSLYFKDREVMRATPRIITSGRRS